MTAVAPRIGSLDAPDGTGLSYRIWEALSPRGAVWIVHGLGEHGGRYARFAETMTDRGFSCLAGDLRGHGTSGGRRGHVDRFDDYLHDQSLLEQFLPAGVPHILFGHSMGGLVALRLVQAGVSVAGLVLSAPLLGLPPGPPGRTTMARVLARIAPTLPLSNGIDPAHLSHAAAEVEAYRADPLVHDRITPRLFDEMNRAMEAAARDAAGVKVPVLLLAPGDDRIVSTAAALRVARRFAGPVTVREYPGMYHEPLHEVQEAEVRETLAAWIAAVAA